MKRRWSALALVACACGAAPSGSSGGAPFAAAPFPDAGPSLAVALLEPLPGASFASGSLIPVTAEIQALGSPVQSCQLLLGGSPFPRPPPSGTTESWNVAASSFDAGVYSLQIIVSDAAGLMATATRTISITP